MTDIFTKKKRSEIMSRIKSFGTKPELELENVLPKGFAKHELGCDFVWNEDRLAVRMMGCFWHGCPAHYRRPKSNVRFWDEKIARNRERDKKVKKILEELGWEVVDVWEHDIKNYVREKNALKGLK